MAVTDLQAKKTFLQQSSSLYAEMIELAPNDIIRRYLAFRVIVNAMSFEDLTQNRQEPRLREIRNVLLAHKQESDFFVAQNAAGEITDGTVAPLLARMAAATGTPASDMLLPELGAGDAAHNFRTLIPQVFDRYNADFIAGHRIIDNFLCLTGDAVQEVTKGHLPGVFYRYHSSKALYDLAEYLFNNCDKRFGLTGLAMHTKLDMLLHAQNMADCAIKDTRNSHSIDGLKEVMENTGVGDPSSLNALDTDATFRATYSRVRSVRNKLIGHMDASVAMVDLIAALNALPPSDHCDLVNMVDKAVHAASMSHPAIKMRYITGNQVLTDPNIRGIAGREPPPYY